MIGSEKAHLVVKGFVGGSAFDECVAMLEQLPAPPAYVLIDFFDTLVHRSVAPESVKDLVARRLSLWSAPEIEAGVLAARRRAIESSLAEKSVRAGFDPEYRLADVFERLAHQCAGPLPRGAWIHLALYTELDVERRVQVLARGVRDFLERLRDRGLRLCCVSDNYLSERQLRALLDMHDLSKYFERVVVSAESLLSKRSGRLFERLCEELQVRPNQLVMIGDNPYVDRDAAQARGLTAFWIDRTEQHQHYSALHIPEEEEDVLPRAGIRFERLAESFLLFTLRLHRQALIDQADTLLFMSREGQLLKWCFDRVQEVLVPPRCRIRSAYLMISRRASFLASLGALQQESFTTLFRQYQRISVRDFITSLGLEAAYDPSTDPDLQTDPDRVEAWFTDSQGFAMLRRSPRFAAAYEHERLRQRRLLLGLLDQLGAGQQRVYLVDIGWKGTIQDNLRNLLPKERDVVGYYFGMVVDNMALANNRKHGLVFSFERPEEPAWVIYNENRALLEAVACADHPSVIGYEEGPDGESLPVFEVSPEAEQRAVALAMQHRDAIMRRFDLILERIARGRCSLRSLERQALRAHAELVFKPTPEEIGFFEALEHYENFGRIEMSRFQIAQQVSAQMRLRTIWNLLVHPADPFVGEHVWWPALRLQQMGLARWLTRYRSAKLASVPTRL